MLDSWSRFRTFAKKPRLPEPSRFIAGHKTTFVYTEGLVYYNGLFIPFSRVFQILTLNEIGAKFKVLQN